LAERRLVIATGNAGKLGEYRELLAGAGLHLMVVDSGVAEVGATYAENAQLKAEAAREALALPAVGDDSGVEVEVLKGFPGIHSARIGPTQKERTQVLLDRLQGQPRPWPARFVCAIALAAPGRPTEFFEGECRGEIIPEWRGVAGFGYDPVFLVPEAGRTFGEMSPEEKARYSHRARAVRAMLASGALERLSV
jgi:XTP/dITP diphosphohydrolase